MHFTLAHFSDVHLGPLGLADAFAHFKLKRLVGSLSWSLNRRKLHRPEVADAIRASMTAAKPDHIACTGDLVNIAAGHEFPRAARWLEALGNTSTVSLVPGNHECYVDVPHAESLAHLAPWMKDAPPFPYVHLRRNIALIGLNSGSPQRLHRAAGELGEHQRRNLGHHLERLGQQGFCRIVMIHHPPLPDLAKPRKALVDAAALTEVLKRHGCELVLHGHNHHFMHNKLNTAAGTAHVIGAPSASMRPIAGHEAAGWNEFRIRRVTGAWQIELCRHTWSPDTGEVTETAPALLSPA